MRLSKGLDAFVVDTTQAGIALELCDELRSFGLAVERAFDRRSMKAQLKAADRSGARVACIVGAEDLAAGASNHPGAAGPGRAHTRKGGPRRSFGPPLRDHEVTMSLTVDEDLVPAGLRTAYCGALRPATRAGR